MNIKSNVNKVHIEGVVLTLGAETFMLPFVLADSDHDAIAVARGWKGLMFEEYEYGTFFTSARMMQDSAHGPGAFFLFAIRILFGRAAWPTKSISW